MYFDEEEIEDLVNQDIDVDIKEQNRLLVARINELKNAIKVFNESQCDLINENKLLKKNINDYISSIMIEKMRKMKHQVNVLGFNSLKDAERYRWLRNQGGWPESEAAVSGLTPEQFDDMIDKKMSEDSKYEALSLDEDKVFFPNHVELGKHNDK